MELNELTEQLFLGRSSPYQGSSSSRYKGPGWESCLVYSVRKVAGVTRALREGGRMEGSAVEGFEI